VLGEVETRFFATSCSHKAPTSRSAIHDCGFEKLIHPPYNADMAPSNLYLFSKLNKIFKGGDFLKVKQSRRLFSDKNETFFSFGIESLHEHWECVIEGDGHYLID
jgi:hypothetical protein